MIYVFMVDNGTMLTFDMNLALETVSVLKGAISRSTRIPSDKQVLLASGGLALEEGQKVCFYPSGTDTNPIFLFSKSAIECHNPPTPPLPPETDGADLKAQVEGCLNMPASYNTVVARTQLAQQFYESARDIIRSCTQLVHDQHLQQQGWAAVVANLEDIVQAFKARFDGLKYAFSDYLTGRDDKVKLLQSFEDDLKLLSRIPVFPELLGKKKEEEEEEEDEEEEEREEGDGRTSLSLSLLDWISATDTQNDVRQIAERCYRGLSQISEGQLDKLSTEVIAVLREADRPEMKEVKGLEERLCGLEQLMHDAEFVVQEQHNFSQALLKNQDRAGKVNDPSIFPDLCTSHRKNLMHMLRNHQKLLDIKRRCIKAKEELSENLHHRLKWIMYIERKLYEADTRIEMNQENVRRLFGSLQVVEQIHRAPRVYAAAVTEVARRQAFSRGFLQWATRLSSESDGVWKREVHTRRLFLQDFSSHFLASLFPGLDEMPPNFATSLPDKFDLALPKITESHIKQLQVLLPELSDYLVVGEVVAVPPLLQHLYLETQTLEKENEGTRAVKNKRPETNYELSKHIRLEKTEDDNDLDNSGDFLALQMELGAAKVEIEALRSRLTQLTDLKKQVHSLKTKVQSESSAYLAYVTQVSATVLDLLAQSQEHTDSELQRAHTQLADAHRQITAYTAQLEDAHRELDVYMDQLQQASSQIEEMRENGREERRKRREEDEEEEEKRREEVRKMRLEHEVELATLRQHLAALQQSQESTHPTEEELEAKMNARLKEEKEKIVKILESSFNEREKIAIDKMEEELSLRLEEEKERARAEERERLSEELEREKDDAIAKARSQFEEEMERKMNELVEGERQKYRLELESIRSRFKIMATTTNPLPSSSSSSSSSPPPLPPPFDPPSSPSSRWEGLEKLREEIEREKERELSERFAHLREEERKKVEEEKQVEFAEELRKIEQDKERIIEDLKIRVKLLTDEIDRKGGGSEWPRAVKMDEETTELKATIDSLRVQVHSLETELSRMKRFSFVTQPSTTTTTATTTTATTATTASLTTSVIAEKSEGVKLGACYPGDHVLIVYDSRHSHYRVILEQSNYLHFVHSDSHAALGICRDNPQHKLYCAAEVISKEFCQAKKDDNRFRVPKGTRFYRVVVKPWDGSSSSGSGSPTTTTATTDSATTAAAAATATD